jgi:TrmH family RNA methyltransferase
MGAVFAVPLARVATLAELPGEKIALVAHAGDPLPELWRSTPVYARSSAKVRREATVLVGSERDGLPEEIAAQADRVAHIPIRTDSLNAAMAATIALYELTRRMAPE